MNITEEFITQFAVNSSSLTNGRNLYKKGSFSDLSISKDGTLIFGVCKGSGKKGYNCSFDLLEKDNPIPRCSCPSRQIPCKHVIGLLYCYLNKEGFTEGNIPEDIVSKREKLEKKKTKSSEIKPQVLTKAKATSAIKKYKLQIEGIELSERILNNIVLSGIHSINKKKEALYEEQIKEIGNYYIPGIQASFINLLDICSTAQREQKFSKCINEINYMNALLKKSKEHLENKISDYEGYPVVKDTSKKLLLNSAIEEQMGYAWKLSELKEIGLSKENIELIQISFNCYEDNANARYIDEGIWMCLDTGKIHKTYNYRPFKAKNYISEEDSFFSVLNVSELYFYPGELNSRIRWENSTFRDLENEDLEKLKRFSNDDYSEVIKKVKSQIKSPLSDKNPIYALKISDIRKDNKGNLAIFDGNGFGLPLKLEGFSCVIDKLKKDEVKDQSLICSFSQDIEENKLYTIPISIINNKNIIRFYY